MTNAEIDAHPLLTAEERKLCKIFRDMSKRQRTPFSMLDFAQICLRATGIDYANVDVDDNIRSRHRADKKHRRAAILYAYEEIKNGSAIVGDDTLRDLELSHGAA